jgi:hypothetical protein
MVTGVASYAIDASFVKETLDQINVYNDRRQQVYAKTYINKCVPMQAFNRPRPLKL